MVIIKANLERTGQGTVILNGHDISACTCGMTFENDVRKGNTVVLRLPSPSVNITVDSKAVYFEHEGKRYRLVEEMPGDQPHQCGTCYYYPNCPLRFHEGITQCDIPGIGSLWESNVSETWR